MYTTLCTTPHTQPNNKRTKQNHRMSSEEEYTTDDLSSEEDQHHRGGGGAPVPAAAAAAGSFGRKSTSKPRRWQPYEDKLLTAAVNQCGEANWKSIASKVGSRNHVQCLQRWKKVCAWGGGRRAGRIGGRRLNARATNFFCVLNFSRFSVGGAGRGGAPT